MLGWFVETSVVAAVMALPALWATWRGRLGPSARHLLWLVVLVKMVTPPVVRWPERPAIPAARPVAPVVAPAPEVEPDPVAGAQEVAPVGGYFDEPLLDAPIVEIRGPALSNAPRVVNPVARWAGYGWLVGGVALAAVQLGRIVAFRRRLRAGGEAPGWLVDVLAETGRSLGVRPPRVEVVDRISSPMIWCLGPARLLVPRDLVKTLPADRWRGVLAHELAHLRRGDHWVRRLQLLAGLLWWWNPVYWLAVRRLDAEAELACDAWVVNVDPKGRRTYAETLIDVCEAYSRARTPLPALGMAGEGRFFEKRLTMILRENVSNRSGLRGLAAAVAVALLGLPTWSAAQDDAPNEKAKGVVTETVTGKVHITEGKPVNEVRTVTIFGDGTQGETINFTAKLDDKQDAEKAQKAAKDDGQKPNKDNAELKAEIEKARAELDAAQKEFETSTKEIREAMRKAQAELQAKMAMSQKTMAEKARALADVQRKLAETEGRKLRLTWNKEQMATVRELRVEPNVGRTFSVKPSVTVISPAQGHTTTTRVYRTETKADAGPSVEQRLDALEKKFDQILDELKGLKKADSK